MGVARSSVLRVLVVAAVVVAFGGVACTPMNCYMESMEIVGCEGGLYSTPVVCHVDAPGVSAILERSVDFESGYGPFEQWDLQRQCVFMCTVARSPTLHLTEYDIEEGGGESSIDSLFPGNDAWQQAYRIENPTVELGDPEVEIEVCQLDWLPGGEAEVTCDLWLQREVCWPQPEGSSSGDFSCVPPIPT